MKKVDSIRPLILLLFFYTLFQFSIDQHLLLSKLINLGIPMIVTLIHLDYLYRKVKFFDKTIIISIILFGIITTWSLLVPFIYRTGDLSYFASNNFYVLQYIFRYLALAIIYIKVFKKEATIEGFFEMYIDACLLFVASTIIFMLFPSIKNFWFSHIYLSDINRLNIAKSYYFTRVGIDGFAGFGQSFKIIIGVILGLYLNYKVIDNDGFNVKLFLKVFSLALSTMFYGRIGMLISMLLMAILGIRLLRKKSTHSLALIVLIILMSIGTFVLTVALQTEKFQEWFNWAFQFVIRFINTGKFGSPSTDILFKEMYFIPELKTFIFGDGFYTNGLTGEYYMNTDVGILRPILFFGLLPALLNYVLIGNLLYRTIELFKIQRAQKLYWVLIILSVLGLFELKGSIQFVLLPIFVSFYCVTKHDFLVSNRSIQKVK